MKIINIILLLSSIFTFNACSRITPTYEAFEDFADYHVGKSSIPNSFKIDNREIYSEDKYIYISEYPKGCVIGFLTNRDDKPEVVQEWIIISGKEYCKMTKSWVLVQ
ncbi:hypothetical protein ACN9JZ_10975 [Aliarcobacter butzleri]|uniref:hypothetical protein n=1 Tax=Aliarcobacter butzleri TaxID=28197 RepID=UPI0021B25421|nr:hypothetical protein [Aliarcobacter butzleri]MCT7620623.1 hypothetical protein [Aliarcobacter butzleri]MDN5081095.1 hypothetical protein [Aliarcobacter butzleri]